MNIRQFASAYRRSDKIVCAEFEKTVHILNLEAGHRICSFDTCLDFGGTRLAQSSVDDYCVTGAYERYGIQLYDFKGNKVWERSDLKRVQWLDFELHTDNILAGFDDMPMHILDKKTGDTLDKLRGIRAIYQSNLSDARLYCGRHLRLVNGFDSFDIERKTFATLSVDFSEVSVFVSEAGGTIRAVSLESGKEQWIFNPKTGSHFLKVAYDHSSRLLWGILWPYQHGGRKEIWCFDPLSGKAKFSSIIMDQSSTEAFLGQGNKMITSEGTIYNLNSNGISTYKSIE